MPPVAAPAGRPEAPKAPGEGLPRPAPFDASKPVLDLSRRLLGCAGLAALLPSIVTARNLKKLNLSHTNLGNVGVAELAQALRPHPSLEELDLCHNPITTTGGKDLLELIKDNLNIVVIKLVGTSIHRLILDCIQMQLARNSRRAVFQLHAPLLRQVTRLRGLTEAQLTTLAHALQPQEVPSGKALLVVGAPVHTLYLLREGVVHCQGNPGLRCVCGKPIEEEQFFSSGLSLHTWVAQTVARCEALPWAAYAAVLGLSDPSGPPESPGPNTPPLSASGLSYFDVSSDSGAEVLSPLHSEESLLFSPSSLNLWSSDAPVARAAHPSQRALPPALRSPPNVPPLGPLTPERSAETPPPPAASFPQRSLVQRLDDSSSSSSLTTSRHGEDTLSTSDGLNTDSREVPLADVLPSASSSSVGPLGGSLGSWSESTTMSSAGGRGDPPPDRGAAGDSAARRRLRSSRQRAAQLAASLPAEVRDGPEEGGLESGSWSSKQRHRWAMWDSCPAKSPDDIASGPGADPGLPRRPPGGHKYGIRVVASPPPDAEPPPAAGPAVAAADAWAAGPSDAGRDACRTPPPWKRRPSRASQRGARQSSVGRDAESTTRRRRERSRERADSPDPLLMGRGHRSPDRRPAAGSPSPGFEDLLQHRGTATPGPTVATPSTPSRPSAPPDPPSASPLPHKYGQPVASATLPRPAIVPEADRDSELEEAEAEAVRWGRPPIDSPIAPGSCSHGRSGPLLVHPSHAGELAHLGVVSQAQDGSARVSQPLVPARRRRPSAKGFSSPGRRATATPGPRPATPVRARPAEGPAPPAPETPTAARLAAAPASVAPSPAPTTVKSLAPRWTPPPRHGRPSDGSQTLGRWSWTAHLQVIPKPESHRRWLQDVFQDECIFGLTMAEHRRIGSCIDHMRRERWESGQRLLQRRPDGGPCDADKMVIVLSGAVRFEPPPEEPEDNQMVVVGEMELLRDLPPQSDVIVESPTLEAYTLDRRSWRRLRVIELCPDIVHFLRDDVPAIQDLTRKEVLTLKRYARRATLLAGEQLVACGEPLEDVFIVHHGAVRVAATGGTAAAVLWPGELLGDWELACGLSTSTFTATGEEDAVLLVIPRGDFRRCTAALVGGPTGGRRSAPGAADPQYYVTRRPGHACFSPAVSISEALGAFAFGVPESPRGHRRPSAEAAQAARVGNPKDFTPELVAFLASSRRRRPGLSGPSSGQLAGYPAGHRGDPALAEMTSVDGLLAQAHAKSDSDMRTLTRALAGCCLLARLDGRLLQRLALVMRPRRVPAGAMLLRPGEEEEGGWVLVEGTCTEFTAGGSQAARKAGDPLGMHALLFNVATDGGAAATSDCRLFVLPRLAYQRTVTAHYATQRIQYYAPLRAVPHLSLLSADRVLALAEAVACQSVPVGAVLARPGDRRHTLYVVTEGLVRRNGPEGVTQYRIGDVAGAEEFFSPEPCAATYLAEAPARVGVLSGHAFESIVEPVDQYRAHLCAGEERAAPAASLAERRRLAEALEEAAVVPPLTPERPQRAAALAHAAVAVRFRRGQCLWHAGWHAAGEAPLYVMRTGRCVAVSASGAAEPVPDDGVVGHWGAAPPPRHVTVTSDTLDAFAVPRATLDRVLRPPGA